VTLEEDDAVQVLFVAPGGGGAKLASGKVQVITPKSPLGAALIGKRNGDVCEVTLAGRARELTVVAIA